MSMIATLTTKKKKRKDCIVLCHHDLSDDSMPRLLVMKTLVLHTGAVDDWFQAEVRETGLSTLRDAPH
jgi:hypothetical protein